VISRRSCALAGIVIVMIVWGSTFVVTKAAIHEIPPLPSLFCVFSLRPPYWCPSRPRAVGSGVSRNRFPLQRLC
jgi:hypothetical protein